MVGVVCGLVMLPRAAGMVQEAYLSAPNGKDWVQGVLWSLPMVFLFATAGVIIYFSAISYLGLGVPPGVPELGSMLSNEGRQYLFAAPALGLWPAFCLAFSIFTFVMTGDVLLEKMGFRSKAVWSKTME
jgi:ABC-type dipeptide/oligopeptide/nickel transport system permease subunit